MGNNHPLVSFVLLILCLPLFSPLATADNLPEQPQINANWVANELGETLHAYRVVFADGESYQATINVELDRNGLVLDSDIFQSASRKGMNFAKKRKLAFSSIRKRSKQKIGAAGDSGNLGDDVTKGLEVVSKLLYKFLDGMVKKRLCHISSFPLHEFFLTL